MRTVSVETTEPGVVKLETKLKDISRPGGRDLSEIIADMSEVDAAPVAEMIELIDYLVSRLTFADSERFNTYK